MLSISEIVTAVKLGAKLETLIPEGADLNYWQRLVDRNRGSDARPKRKSSKRKASRKASKRTFQASPILNNQVGQAMAEQIDRVNGGQVEARVILVGRPW